MRTIVGQKHAMGTEQEKPHQLPASENDDKKAMGRGRLQRRSRGGELPRFIKLRSPTVAPHVTDLPTAPSPLACKHALNHSHTFRTRGCRWGQTCGCRWGQADMRLQGGAAHDHAHQWRDEEGGEDKRIRIGEQPRLAVCSEGPGEAMAALSGKE